MGKKTRLKWRRLDILDMENPEDAMMEGDSHNVFKSLEKMSTGANISELTGAPIRYNPQLAGTEDTAMAPTQYSNAFYYNNTYYNTPTSLSPQQQVYYPTVPQYGFLPQDSVQFVPYYYYYPVPDISVPTIPLPEISSPAPPQLISSSSCDSSIQNKVIRRRKKKKRTQDKDETVQFHDIDSGYFNGPDSSTELSSGNNSTREEDTGISSEIVDKNNNRDNKLQQNPDENSVIDFEFGDVQEILDELSRETNQSGNEYDTEDKTDNDCKITMEEKDTEETILQGTGQEIDGQSINKTEGITKPITMFIKRTSNSGSSQANEEQKDASRLSDSVKQVEKYETWTKVKNSRKNRTKHPNLDSSKALAEEVSNIKPMTKKGETEIDENKRPLESLKESFFQEKDVIILESKKLDENGGKKTKGKKQRRGILQRKEGITRKIEISSQASSKPFGNFEEFLKSQQSKAVDRPIMEPCYSPLLVSDFSPNRSYSDGLIYRHSDLRDLSFLFGPTEDQLIRMKAVGPGVLRSSQANPIILLRPTPTLFSSFLPTSKVSRKQSQIVKGVDIPGPRVKYLPATRMGVLGIKRMVVPPQCLANRFGKI